MSVASNSTAYLGIMPHTQATFTVPGLEDVQALRQRSFPIDLSLNLDFRTTKPTAWAPAGHLVATGQLPLEHLGRGSGRGYNPFKPDTSIPHPSPLPQPPQRIGSSVTITSTRGSSWEFNLARGTLTSWTRPKAPDHNILTEPITYELYRALTDNDRGGPFGKEWREARLHQAKTHFISSTYTARDDSIIISVKHRIAPPVLNWAVDTTTDFTFFTGKVFKEYSGQLRIHTSAKPTGHHLPKTFARFGISFGLAGASTAQWFGRGPGESYRDKKLSQPLGNYTAPIDDLGTDYEFPQDSGNRCDIRQIGRAHV